MPINLIAQVQKLAEREIPQPTPADESLKYMDWIPVTVKLEYDNGKPVTDSDFTVFLGSQKLLGENSTTVQLDVDPDSDGLVDFGLIKIRKRIAAKPAEPKIIHITII